MAKAESNNKICCMVSPSNYISNVLTQSKVIAPLAITQDSMVREPREEEIKVKNDKLYETLILPYVITNIVVHIYSYLVKDESD